MRRGASIVVFVLVVVAGALAPAAGAGTRSDVRAAACAGLRDPQVRHLVSGAGLIHLQNTCSGRIDQGAAGRTRPRAVPADQENAEANLLINNRSTDTFPDVTQSETTVAVNNGTTIVGFNDSALPKGFTGYSRSTTGGASWTDMGGLPMPLGAVSTMDGDPVVATDRNRLGGQTSVFYFASIATKAGDKRPIVGVYRSDDGGATWSFGRNASPLAPTTDVLQDKEWLAVDTRASGTGAGNVYTCWTRFTTSKSSIQFSRSTDHGLTYTQRATPLSASSAIVQYCQVAVSPVNGDVIVSWFQFDSPNALSGKLMVRTSTDQGQHFGAQKTVASVTMAETQITCGPFTFDVFMDTESGAINRSVRSDPLPSMTFDPVTGAAVMAWEAGSLSGGAGSDIAFARSTDDGVSWGSPVRINSVVTGHQFQPAIAVNQDGELRVAYLSTQNSSTKRKIDVYEVSSIDQGATWSAPDRVTDVSFDRPVTAPNFDPGVACAYMGDYIAEAAPPPGLGDAAFSAAWGDNRLDANPKASGVQPDPDIRFERRDRAASSGGVSGDFDHDGFPDLAVGSPGESQFAINGAKDREGAVHVIYGAAGGLSATGSQEWNQDSTGVPDVGEAGDLFGSALAAGDFNGDSFDDLAVGVPGEDVSGSADAGAVNVLYGSAGGLQATSPAAQFLSQNGKNVDDTAEPGDRFGAAVAAGDFNHDGFDDLAIGVPGEDIPAADAGAVNVLYGGPGGLQVTAPVDQLFWQDAPGIIGAPEAGDEFGASLATGDPGTPASAGDDLAIGVPGEDVGTVPDAGAVNVIYGGASGLSSTGNQIWDQDETNVGDQAEAGDRFGTAVAVADFGGAGTQADLAVGIPGEELGSGVFDSGAVQVFYGTATGLGTDNQQIFDQDFPADVDGARESGDLFGSSLAAGQLSTGQADLAIGVPGENAGSIADSGAVNVIYGGTGGLQLTSPADQLWDQNSANVEGQDEAGDLFGSSLTISGVGQAWLAIGVPREAVGTVAAAGAANVLYGGASGLQTASPADQIWDQDSTGIGDTAEAGDLFGAAVG